MTKHRQDESPEEVVETAILNLCHLRLVEQQAWLAELPYRDPEQRLIVREAHEQLSEPARALLGLVLHYPDEIEEVLKKLPAADSTYVRTGAHANYRVGKGRVVTFARRRWGMTIKQGQRVVDELRDFVGTLAHK